MRGLTALLLVVVGFVAAIAMQNPSTARNNAVAFSASNAIYTPSPFPQVQSLQDAHVQQQQLNSAENNLIAAQLNVTRSAEEARAAHFAALSAQATSDHTALQATDVAAVATTQAHAAAQATADHWQIVTFDAQQAQFQADNLATSQAQSLIAEATRAAIAIISTQSVNQINQANAAATSEAHATTVAQQAIYNAQRDQRIALQRAAQNREVALLIAVVLLALTVVIGSWLTFEYITAQRESQRPIQHITIDGRTLTVAHPDWNVIDQPAQIAATAPNQSRSLSEPPDFSFLNNQRIVPTAISHLSDQPVILLNGAQGTGKTAFALHLAAERPNALVIDPKPRTPWPQSADKIIGRGYNWQTITNALANLIDEMESRYNKMSRDHSYNPAEMWIIIDEWPSLATNVDDAADILKRIIFEGREAALRMILITQSADVRTLGIEGQGALREAFTFVNLSKDIRGNRSATIVRGDDSRTFPHPGPYTPPSPQRTPVAPVIESVEPQLDWIDEMLPTQHTDLDTPQTFDAGTADDVLIGRIRRFYHQSSSIRELARLVFNHADGGGSYSARIKDLLNYMNLPTPASPQKPIFLSGEIIA